MAFKEQCGLPPVSTLKQCMQSLATRLQSPDGPPGASLILKDGYPCLEPLANLNDTTRKLLNAYDTVSNSHAQRFTEKKYPERLWNRHSTDRRVMSHYRLQRGCFLRYKCNNFKEKQFLEASAGDRIHTCNCVTVCVRIWTCLALRILKYPYLYLYSG